MSVRLRLLRNPGKIDSAMSKKRKDKKLREWQKKLSAQNEPSSEPSVVEDEQESVPTPKAEPRSWADRSWSWLVPSLLLGLLLVLNFRPIMQNDFWMHLKIGEDILEKFEVPYVDTYSAVAAGRPFIAHEWLSGALLALVGGVFGATGFTLLGEGVAASIAVLLFFAVPKPARSSVMLAPLGAIAIYSAAFRLVIRPDLFTMLLLAVWAFAIERWRASRKRWLLMMLVPLMVLWANLHGAFLFGVVSLCGLAVLVAIEHFGNLQKTGEARYTRADLVLAASVAGASVLACLLNPQGWNLPLFSLQMTTGQAFEQVRAVTEWQPTFDTQSYFYQNFPYLVYACGAWLLLLWCGLLLRVFDRPILDLAIAGVVTYLAVRQNRFIPYAAIFGFPIALRSWHELGQRYGHELYAGLSSSRVSKTVAALLVTVPILIAFRRGYPLGPANNSALGSGFGSRHPQAEAAYIKENGLSGVLYNERMPDGAYLIRELSPVVRPVMDMRLDVYGKELCDEYDATKSSRQELNNYVYKYGVNLALVGSGGWIEEHFRRSLGFRQVFAGSERSVLVR